MRAVPFFLSALLFLSGVFSPLAPLPIIVSAMRNGRGWALSAAFVNALIVYQVGGRSSFALYFLFVFVLAAALSEALRRGVRVERALMAGLVSVLAMCTLWLAVQAQGNGVTLAAELKSQVDGLVLTVEQSLSEKARQALMESTSASGEASADAWKRAFISELPSALLIFVLIMAWGNLWLTIWINPGRLRERLRIGAEDFNRWKAPEWLVWPTIASGFALAFGAWLKLPEMTGDIAMNAFKVFMAVYVMQGLSVLSFCFAAWRVSPLFRAVFFVAALFAMIPLVLSVGFFDLWFDFRAKIRQS